VSLGAVAIIQAAVDHLLAIGLFESVQGHETKSAPGNGLTCDVWLGPIKPVPANSGLATTSALLTLIARVYANATTEPVDEIETNVAGAVDALMTAYSASFTFGGLVEYIDLLGAHGQPLSADPGYVTVGGVFFRCMTITVPCVIENAWAQSPS